MNELTDKQEVETPALVDWKNPPSLMALKQDLTDAKPIHDAQVTKVDGWLDNLHITGKAKLTVAKGNSAIQPKLIRKQAEWRYPALTEPFLSTDELFKVKPRTLNDRKAAQQNQILLNYQLNTVIDKTNFIDEYVRTAVDEGTVVVKAGWKFEEEEYELEVPVVEYVIDPTFAPTIQQIDQLKTESPSDYLTEVPEELQEAYDLSLEQGVPVRPNIVGTKTVKRMRTVKNHPTLEVMATRDVVFDPTCKGIVEDAGFAIESFESSKSILQKDKRYKNLDQIQIGQNSPLSQPDRPSDGGSFTFSDEPRKKFVVHLYWGNWDIHGTGTVEPVVVGWVGNTIVRMELNPFPDKAHPFVVERLLPVRKSIYGEPDGALLEDNQKIIGAVTRGIIDVMGKSANGQTGMRKDLLDVTNRRKFDKGQDYEFNPNVDPRVGVYQHVYPEIPQSAPLMLQMQNQDAESLTGVKSFSQGVSGQALGDVAAGVRGALDAASKRELGILRRLSNGIVKCGRKLIAMNGEFLSKMEVVRVTDEEFVEVRRDDLAGTFDLELGISTAEEDNNKAEQLAFMYQTTAPNGDAGLNKMILSDIARLRKMPDLAKKIETYEPPPNPLVEMKLKLEVALLEAQVAKEKAQAQHYLSQAQLNGGKTATEAVKAGNLQADTDRKNLDFVEQESGVTQERQKELHGAQAEAQTKLKLVEHSIQVGENAKDRQHDLLKEYVKARNRPKAK